jgi:hypothetical protein
MLFFGSPQRLLQSSSMGDRQAADMLHAGFFQCFRRFHERRAGREEIIDHDDGWRCGDRTAVSKRAIERVETIGFRTIHLSAGSSCAREEMLNGECRMLRESVRKELGLIESAGKFSRPVERNRTKNGFLTMRKIERQESRDRVTQKQTQTVSE